MEKSDYIKGILKRLKEAALNYGRLKTCNCFIDNRGNIIYLCASDVIIHMEQFTKVMQYEAVNLIIELSTASLPEDY